jgi:hypothetical protein
MARNEPLWRTLLWMLLGYQILWDTRASDKS